VALCSDAAEMGSRRENAATIPHIRIGSWRKCPGAVVLMESDQDKAMSKGKEWRVGL
jgi:hypothetical protein